MKKKIFATLLFFFITSLQNAQIIDLSGTPVLPGDPLKDITEIERVQFVMKGVVVYKINGKEVIVTLEAK